MLSVLFPSYCMEELCQMRWRWDESLKMCFIFFVFCLIILIDVCRCCSLVSFFVVLCHVCQSELGVFLFSSFFVNGILMVVRD